MEPAQLTNGMSVDVEEWFQVGAFEGVIQRDGWDNLPQRVERNCETILDLFAEAAESEDKASRWTAEADEDDEGEDDDEDEYGDDDSASDWSSARLKLHLSDELIAQTRVRLRSVWQENKGF